MLLKSGVLFPDHRSQHGQLCRHSSQLSPSPSSHPLLLYTSGTVTTAAPKATEWSLCLRLLKNACTAPKAQSTSVRQTRAFSSREHRMNMSWPWTVASSSATPPRPQKSPNVPLQPAAVLAPGSPSLGVHSCPARLPPPRLPRLYCYVTAPEFTDGGFSPIWDTHLDERPGK